MKSAKPGEAERDAVRTRDGHYCARCGRSVLDYPSSIHHRLPRRMGGTRDPRSNDLRNLVRLCGSATSEGGCHGDVESNRAKAIDDGWLIRSYDDLDRPMLITTSGVLQLRADGAAIYSAAPLKAALHKAGAQS